MKYIDLEKYYLCGIGTHNEIKDFQVGIYKKERESFSISNGSYSANEYHKEPRGSDATYIISATPLQEIDDKELLYKYINKDEVEEIPQMKGTRDALDGLTL